MRAQSRIACPMWSIDKRTGTATRRRCIPISVPPMSMPAAALTSSTRTGSLKRCQQFVAQLPPLPAAVLAFTLFTAASVAEIVRGGLASVPAGQYEAARSQGCSAPQMYLYIILPQAFRIIIPTLMSQVITIIKDTSFLANVATIELMARVNKVLSGAALYNGTGKINVSDVFVLFGFAALVYFIINYSLSCVVRHVQANLEKVGESEPAPEVPVNVEMAK